MSAWLSLAEDTLQGSWMATLFLCVLTDSTPAYTVRGREYKRTCFPSVSFLIRALIPSDQGPTLVTLITFQGSSDIIGC